MSFQVQGKMCASCIYRPDSPLDIAELEREIADPDSEGFFTTYRQCHHSNRACCKGFWDRHRDHFQAGQIAQRFNVVEFVEHDTIGNVR